MSFLFDLWTPHLWVADKHYLIFCEDIYLMREDTVDALSYKLWRIVFFDKYKLWRIVRDKFYIWYWKWWCSSMEVFELSCNTPSQLILVYTWTQNIDSLISNISILWFILFHMLFPVTAKRWRSWYQKGRPREGTNGMWCLSWDFSKYIVLNLMPELICALMLFCNVEFYGDFL